ncbi:MAG: glycine cleavage system protein GcvH [Phycisphaeraceae bacterium]
MPSPTDRRYLESHEWHKLDGGLVTIGISQFAVDELTDITYLDVRKKSGAIKAGESFGEIESVKATSDLYCGIDGQVVAVNQAVITDPAIINQDPFDKGWIIKVKPSDPGQVETLIAADAYDKMHG